MPINQITPPPSHFGEVLGRRQNLMQRLADDRVAKGPWSMRYLNPVSKHNKAQLQTVKELAGGSIKDISNWINRGGGPGGGLGAFNLKTLLSKIKTPVNQGGGFPPPIGADAFAYRR